MWQSQSSKSSNRSGLSSIVLDSLGIPLEKSLKDNQFTYRFIQQDSSSNLSEVSNVSSSVSLENDLDSTLRSGDHVVCILSYYYMEIIGCSCDIWLFNKIKVKFAMWYGRYNNSHSICSEECTQGIPKF